jgi:Holliday junction resolvase RusA-like endonuclease
MPVILKVKGLPVPQGSMTCVGAGVGRPHRLVSSNQDALNAWRNQIAAAARKAVETLGTRWVVHDPVRVDLTFTLIRPKSVDRDWPSIAPDEDRYRRPVLEALIKGGIWNDDGQSIGGINWTTYPHMREYAPIPDDVMDVEGVVIRLSDAPVNQNRLI